jgi:hypothetical protein
MSKIIGYKVFNSDWTCRGFQYEVGKEYFYDGNIEMCGAGFHFCQKIADCFNYYSFNKNNKVAKVEVVEGGVCETKEDKSVTNHIRIIKEVSWIEMLSLANEGVDNNGYMNNGDKNNGNMNNGYMNNGDMNNGYMNNGDMNNGYMNNGDKNNGNMNNGNMNNGNMNNGYKNNGYMNNGNMNNGDMNNGDKNNGNMNNGNMNNGDKNNGDMNMINNSFGIFGTKEIMFKSFDKKTDLTLIEWRNSKAYNLIYQNFETTVWICSDNMTEEEKVNNAQHITNGGYLRSLTFKESCDNMWKCLTDEEKEIIKQIPNFDTNKFEKITGITI